MNDFCQVSGTGYPTGEALNRAMQRSILPVESIRIDKHPEPVDPLWDRAVATVIETGWASPCMLKRNLGISSKVVDELLARLIQQGILCSEPVGKSVRHAVNKAVTHG